jgi:type VI secretion system protein ImpH
MPFDLRHTVFREGASFDFFQAVSVLERYYCGEVFVGESASLGNIRFSTDNSIAFPGSDIVAIEQTDKEKIVMYLSFMGLYGVSSPLPSYFCDPITSKKEAFYPLRKFLDLFGHRIYSLFYRAWKKYRHSINFKAKGTDTITGGLYCLSGQGTSLPAEDNWSLQNELRKISFGRFSQKVRSAANLKWLLSGYFQIEPIQIKPFASHWTTNPAKTILGDSTYTLGRGLHLGERLKDSAGNFIISIGPVPNHLFQQFFPSWKMKYSSDHLNSEQEQNRQKSSLSEQMSALVHNFLRDPLDFVIEVILDTHSLGQPVLGSSVALLGRGFWLGNRPSEEIKIKISN